NRVGEGLERVRKSRLRSDLGGKFHPHLRIRQLLDGGGRPGRKLQGARQACANHETSHVLSILTERESLTPRESTRPGRESRLVRHSNRCMPARPNGSVVPS